MNTKIVVLVLAAVVCIAAAQVLRVPLSKVERTPYEKKARWASIRSGEYANRVAAKFLGQNPVDPFKNCTRHKFFYFFQEDQEDLC